MPTTARVTPPTRTTRSLGLVALLCWLTVALEGFDLVAFGAVIPTLLRTGHLGMGPGQVGLVATVSLVGVGLGAAFGGAFIGLFDALGTTVGSTAIGPSGWALFPLVTGAAGIGPAVLAYGGGLLIGYVTGWAATYFFGFSRESLAALNTDELDAQRASLVGDRPAPQEQPAPGTRPLTQD